MLTLFQATFLCWKFFALFIAYHSILVLMQISSRDFDLIISDHEMLLLFLQRIALLIFSIVIWRKSAWLTKKTIRDIADTGNCSTPTITKELEPLLIASCVVVGLFLVANSITSLSSIVGIIIKFSVLETFTQSLWLVLFTSIAKLLVGLTLIFGSSWMFALILKIRKY